MTKFRIREIKAITKANSAHQSIITELLAEIEDLQRRTRSGDHIPDPEELPIKAETNPKKKARGTREEIIAYAAELGLTPNDALWFFEKMTENDWKVGKQPVKCWKGRMRTWNLGAFFPSQKQNGNGQQPAAPKGPARCTL